MTRKEEIEQAALKYMGGKWDFINGAEWADKTMIEKAVEWLSTHSESDYFELIPDANYCGAGNLNKKRMIEDFKQAMKQ